MIGKVLVVGLGQFGSVVAKTLAQKGFFVVAADSNMELIQQISKSVDRAVQIDSTDEAALVGIGIDLIDTAICAIGEKYHESSIMTTALFKQLGVQRIIARATSPLHARILRAVGASETINPEEQMAIRLATRLAQPGLIDMIPLSDDFVVSEIRCPVLFYNRSLIDLKLRNSYGITVITIKRAAEGKNRGILVNPEPNQVLLPDDVLLVVGLADDVNRLTQLE